MTDVATTASLWDLFDTDSGAESSGAWVEIGPASFLLARAGGANEAFSKAATKRLAPFQTSIESLPKKVADDLAVGIFVDTVLLDWKNVRWLDGTPTDYSKEKAKELLTLLPNLFAALRAEAGKLSNFNKANLQAAAKN